MILRPIHIDEDKCIEIYNNPDCQEIFKSYPDYYFKTGYNPPWIGYFVIDDDKVVGVCGFTGAPKDGRVEIAYGTFKQHEGQGIASYGCRELISITMSADPKIIITAKTAPEENASVKILKRNGFVFTGMVQDEGIGDAWEWIKVKSEWSMVNGQWSMVNGQWSMVNGQWSINIGGLKILIIIYV